MNRGPGHMRIGSVLASWNTPRRGGEPMVDGGITTLVHDDGRKEEFGGLVLRLHHRLLTVSLLGRRGPNPRRWRPRLLARRLWCRAWWTITRRPPPLPSASGHDFCPEADE